jgi:transcriptional regulator with GAF, ATPase, and Fis domain
VAADEHAPARTPAAAAFAQLDAMHLSEQSVDAVLQAVVDLVPQVLPGDVEASVTVLVADRPTTLATSGPLALELDEGQYARGHGPAIQAASRALIVEVADARSEPRWPDHMRRAVELGCLSSLSIPLGSPEQLPAALNLYARQPAAFDEAARENASRFARFAGTAAATMHGYQNARAVADDLQLVLESRAMVDQAKGILVERHQLTPDLAFHLLARAAGRTGRTLPQVAGHLIATGQLLGSPARP